MASQIAAHYDRAGATEQAVAWYRRAAAVAQQLHASGPAVRQLNRALGLLRSMPPSANRDAVELEVHTALLVPLISMTGYLSPALSATQQRARELAGTGLSGTGLASTGGFDLVATYGDFDAATPLDAPAAWRMILILQAAGTR